MHKKSWTKSPTLLSLIVYYSILLNDCVDSNDVTVNDLRPILSGSHVERIFVNGRTAEKMYRRYTEPMLGIRAVCLPSTSPANAACSLERLTAEWRALILE